ncbi:MAG: hypothetical protein IT454_11685 [Planctomycetes bacterium]|nr:hypothetical protein [Planctomycetota bacterium]
MSPERKLERLCRRHRVPLSIGQRLLPLVERAARADSELRRRLLDVVEATLARDAEELSHAEHLDERCLIAVASKLHRWSPGDAPPRI